MYGNTKPSAGHTARALQHPSTPRPDLGGTGQLRAASSHVQLEQETGGKGATLQGGGGGGGSVNLALIECPIKIPGSVTQQFYLKVRVLFF